MPDRISKKLRKLIADRAFHLCEYCKSPQTYSPSPFDVEHIIPKSRGGQSDSDNLAYSCNDYKSNKISATDPINHLEIPIFHPRKNIWSDHFAWDVSGLFIIGTTPNGRASVDLLKLNRLELVNLRSLLTMIGKHPPR